MQGRFVSYNYSALIILWSKKKKREKKREKRENEIRFLNGKQLETVACKIWAFTLVVILNKIHTYRS